MKHHLFAIAGLTIMGGTAFAQGYPPQMMPDGSIMPGLSNGNPMGRFNNTWGGFNEVMSNSHTYHDPYTGYNYNAANDKHQWVGSGGRRAQTWYNVPPPGMGWYRLNR